MLIFNLRNHFFAASILCFFGLTCNVAQAEGLSLSSVTEAGISHKNGDLGFTFALSGAGQYVSPVSPWGADFKYDLAARPFNSFDDFDGFDRARLEFAVHRELGSGRLVSRLGVLPALAQTGANAAAIRTGLAFGVEGFSNGFSTNLYSLASQTEFANEKVSLRDAIGLAHDAGRVKAWDLKFEPIPNTVSLQLLGYSGTAVYGAYNISGAGAGWGAEANAALWGDTVQLRYALAQTKWTPIALAQESGRRDNLELTFAPTGQEYFLRFEIDDVEQGFYSPLSPNLADGTLNVSADIAFSQPNFDLSFGVARRREVGTSDIGVAHEVLGDIRYSPPGASGHLSLTSQFFFQHYDEAIPTTVGIFHETTDTLLAAVGAEYTGGAWDVGLELGLIRAEKSNLTHSTEGFLNAFVSYSNEGGIEFDLETSLTRQKDILGLGWDREVSFELRWDEVSTCCDLALSGRYIDYEDVIKTDLLIAEVNLSHTLSPSSELVLFARHGRGDRKDLAGNIKGTQIGFSIRKTGFLAL